MNIAWNDLEKLYKSRTTRNAILIPTSALFTWATNQPDIKENPDGTLSFINTKQSKGDAR